jgi:beta-lactamase family protein
LIVLADTPSPPFELERPALVAPAPREVSFGRIAGTVGPGTRRIIVSVEGERLADKTLTGRRFSLTVALPLRDVAVRVTAVGARGERRTTEVRPVYGLPRAAAPTPVLGFEDPSLARAARALARGFPGVAAVYLQDLRTGAGAAWNARARFPAASTLKMAIAIEVMRALRVKPAPESRLSRLLWRMLVHSDNEAANELEVWLGGSTSGGAAKVNATMRALGLPDSEMYGGYALETAAGAKPIPLRVDRQPGFGRGKRTTAADLARLSRLLHQAAGGDGALVKQLHGDFTPSDARFLLYALAHSADRGKLDRLVGPKGAVSVLHKAGWIHYARHDVGLVYWRGGVFVAAVMTWDAGGVGPSSDRLAGRVALAALDRFRQRLREESYDKWRANRA